MQTDLSKRYGCMAAGVNDIRSHPWFRSIDWTELKNATAEPPIRCVKLPPIAVAGKGVHGQATTRTARQLLCNHSGAGRRGTLAKHQISSHTASRH